MNRIVIFSDNLSQTARHRIEHTFPDFSFFSTSEMQLEDLTGKTLLLASGVNGIGNDRPMMDFLCAQKQLPTAFRDTTVACFVESETLRFTREAGIRYLYLTNRMGAHLPGRSLVEASQDLENLDALSDALGATSEKILTGQLEGARKRLLTPHEKKERPRLSVWTIGREGVSATRAVWDQVAQHLQGVDYDLLSFGNQNIRDCRGCAYEICKKMGEQTRCIYDDYVVESLYPSIEACDALLILAPNYNDMLPANIVSAINRMTALFRKRKFYDKRLFSIIVAGHTGAELLSRQLISALHVNKTFALPPCFSFEVRAHNVASVEGNPTLPSRAKLFAEHIQANLIR